MNKQIKITIDEAIKKLEDIVCVNHPDDGVVYLSNDSPTYYSEKLKCRVYQHEHFSPLGDALIELHEILLKIKSLVNKE